MKSKLYLVLINFNLISLALSIKVKDSIVFATSEKEKEISISSTTRYKASFNKQGNSEKYLYIYPKNYEDEIITEAAFKIYFNEYKEEEENINYMDSNYSTLDTNSGLFIKIGDLNYEEANIFIVTYEKCEFILVYTITNEITFPEFDRYSNFQLNQFILPNKKEGITIKFKKKYKVNQKLLVLSKTSLRNFEITVKYGTDYYTNSNGAYLYPNGFSFNCEDATFENNKDLEVKIINKNNKDEIIILGFIHYIKDHIFPNSIFNGMQLYVERDNDALQYEYLKNSVTSRNYQYLCYQTYSKNLKLTFLDKEEYLIKTFSISKYNSMFMANLDGNDQIRFDFKEATSRASFFFQYLDFTNNEITQRLLQPLVTGSPKSILLPKGASLYHFLPKERDSTNIHYYLKSQSSEEKFITFRTCTNYPEECTFKGESDLSSHFIKNIGLWYTQTTNTTELPLIYIYCKNGCSYDIIMTYDDDPLFLFPDNNYMKFIGENGKDSFILPVFEELSNNEAIKIDFNIISGKGNAKLILYEKRGGSKISTTPTIIGRKQTYIIEKSVFEGASYYKKDIYATIEGDKNIFYDLIYMSGPIQSKTLENNKIIRESLTVPSLNNESEETKIFTFTNDNSNSFYISISSKSCQSKIIINNEASSASQGYYHNIAKNAKGSFEIKIYLINDEDICKQGFEEEITLFAYNSDNANVLINENDFVNMELNSNQFEFIHLFKPSIDDNDDNSFNIEIDKLSNSLSFSYTLEKISFEPSINQEENLSFSTGKITINDRKNNIINNNLIKQYCELKENEICSIKMEFSSTNKAQFNLFFNKFGRKYARQLPERTLINSINTKSIQYYYIDLSKQYDTEVLINTYGQDLEISSKFYSNANRPNEETVLPSEFKHIPNYYKISQNKNENCGRFCRLYIGIKTSKDPNKRELFTTFSINYIFTISEESPSINLPFNYFAQYSFEDSKFTKMNYFIKTYAKTNLNLELNVIKENENDKSEVIASLDGVEEKLLNSSTGPLNLTNFEGELKLCVTSSGENKPTFRLKISSNGDALAYPVIPILPSYTEKCKSEICFYTLDLSQENDAQYAYFFIPETENVVISAQTVNENSPISKFLSKDATYEYNSDKANKRKNWLEYKINNNKNIVLLLRVKSPKSQELNLFTSFYSKPNLITLTNEEKRIFSIQNSSLDNIAFNFNKPKSSKNKYKIFLHAVKGNGIIRYKDDLYALGPDSNYKENISLIIDDDSQLNINNAKDNTYENIFSFTIEYIILSKDNFIYEIKENIINSFKFNLNENFEKIVFYMKANKADKSTFKDISMNIKLFTKTSKYKIDSYIVDDSFLENENKIPNDGLNSTVGKIHTFVDGVSEKRGSLTFLKLEISSDEFIPYFNETEAKTLYAYIVFTPEEKNKKVKIDLYPYELPFINNFEHPLYRNEYFVQKLPANSENYQLLLTKYDKLSTDSKIQIDLILPTSKIYNLAFNYFAQNNINSKVNDSALVNCSDQNTFISGKYRMFLDSNSNVNQLYILLNIMAKTGENEPKDDSFIFKYGYEKEELYSEHVYEKDYEKFSVRGKTKGVKFEVKPSLPKYKTGETVLIFNLYESRVVPDKNPGEDYLSIYLLFSDIKPKYTFYKSPEEVEKEFTITSITKKGEYYITCVAVIQDNERVDFLGYKAKKYKIEEADESLLDYMKDHTIASIIILIVLFFILGVIINSCRVERKGAKDSSSKTVELILEDKNIN